MKVLALVSLVLGYTSALGSGPYLPSGWRPQGPAFLLPTEAQKVSPTFEVALSEESEASSNFLREYGPPGVREVSQDLSLQELPDLVTEQAFAIDARSGRSQATDDEVVEVSSEQVEQIATATEAQINIEEVTTTIVEVETLIEGKADVEKTQAIIEVEKESTEAPEEADNMITNTESAVEEREETLEEVVVGSGVKNIADALVNLEKEIKDQQVQNVKEVIEVKTLPEILRSGQGSEDLLEYGPPGFREYGPPKSEDRFRTEVAEETSADATPDVGPDATRSRRFSPKFQIRSPTRKH